MNRNFTLHSHACDIVTNKKLLAVCRGSASRKRKVVLRWGRWDASDNPENYMEYMGTQPHIDLPELNAGKSFASPRVWQATLITTKLPTYFIDFHSIRWLKPSIHVGDSIVLLLQNWLRKPYLQLASKHHPASPYHKRNCQETFECCSSPQGTSAWTDGSPMRPLLFGWFGKVQNQTNIFKLSSVQISWCKVPCFFAHVWKYQTHPSPPICFWPSYTWTRWSAFPQASNSICRATKAASAPLP